jgi:hypothetical protein
LNPYQAGSWHRLTLPARYVVMATVANEHVKQSGRFFGRPFIPQAHGGNGGCAGGALQK